MYKVALNSRFIKDCVRFMDVYKVGYISGKDFSLTKIEDKYQLVYIDIKTDIISFPELKEFVKNCKYYGDEIE